jgi:hypothetical protein
MAELNEQELDRIFRMAGHEQAPDGLREAVMARILAQQAPVEAAPLLRPWQWVLGGLFLAACIVGLLALPGGASPTPLSGPWDELGGTFAKAAALLASQMNWLAPAMGTALLLALAERWRTGHRPVHPA